MIDVGIAKGSFSYRKSELAQADRASLYDNTSSTDFMQTLRQTNSSVTGTEKTENNSAAYSKRADDTKTGSALSKPNYEQSAENSDEISGTAASGGNVKLDDEAVKELEQLKGMGNAEETAEKASGFSEKQTSDILSQKGEVIDKSLLEQAEEALAGAILKAFNELNDPNKNLEEFEEKLLTFLMKFVDSINGKTDGETSVDSDKEDEEKLGGALMQIIENMLESAKKNAEMNGQTALDVNCFFDTNTNVSAENLSVSAVSVNGTAEQFVKPQDRIDANAAVLNQVDRLNGGEAAAEKNVSPSAEVSGASTTDIADTLTSGGLEQNRFDRLSFDSVDSPVHTQSVSNNAAQTELSSLSEQMPVTSEKYPESASPFNGTNVNHSIEDAALSFNETDAYSLPAQNLGAVDEAVGNQVVFFDGQTRTSSLSKTEQTETAPAIVDEVTAVETENGLYEQLAQAVYEDVEQSFKAVKETNAKPIALNDAEQNAVKAENAPENELDELAQLLGLRKSGAPSENDSSDNSGNSARNGKDGGNDIFFSDIKLVSAREIEPPVLESSSGGAVDKVVTQVVNHILANLPQKEQETSLTVTLDPESLGKISIKLVENAGKLSVTITAENRETAAMLSSRAENVQESMRDQGTQLEKYQVVCSAEQDGRSEQQNYEGSSKNPYVRNIDEEGDDDGEFEEILRGAV